MKTSQTQLVGSQIRSILRLWPVGSSGSYNGKPKSSGSAALGLIAKKKVEENS